MKEFIEKLIGRLEEVAIEMYRDPTVDDEPCSGLIPTGDKDILLSKIKNIVNQLAEEYNNGWIPYVTGCEMPNEASRVWLSFTTPIASFVKSAWYINGHFEWDNCKRVKETPMAWKPYNIPEPYQAKGE